MNYAVALGVYSVRYPAVFWSCNKPLATIFSFQLIVNSAQSLLAYVGMSVLYKASCKHNLFPLRIFFLSFRSLNQEICFDLFSGPSNGAFEGATSSSSTISYDIDHKQHIDHFRGLVLFAESTRYARSVRSLLPFGALLKHGDVFLRLRQVSCLLSFSSIPFHSIPFHSVPFRSVPRKKSFALMKITKITFMYWRNEILWEKRRNITTFEKRCEYFENRSLIRS